MMASWKQQIIRMIQQEMPFVKCDFSVNRTLFIVF